MVVIHDNSEFRQKAHGGGMRLLDVDCLYPVGADVFLPNSDAPRLSLVRMARAANHSNPSNPSALSASTKCSCYMYLPHDAFHPANQRQRRVFGFLGASQMVVQKQKPPRPRFSFHFYLAHVHVL